MKKIYSVLLMATALFIGTSVQADDAHVSTIADLNAKLADEAIETIYLDADLTYAGEGCINIMRSVVIDGQGHTLSGQGVRTGSTYSSLAINQGAPSNSNWIDSVALKNLIIKNTRSAGQALNVRCNLSALLVDNCEIITTNAGGNSQPITFGGNQSTPVRFYVYDSKVLANNSGYPVITFNPIALTTRNTTYSGYCGLYFKGPNSSAGSRGSVVNADACNFECPNVHSGATNAFSCFPLADDGITLNLHNCGVNNQQIGDQNQALVTVGNDSRSDRREQPITINISGDNSYINIGGGINKTFQNLWVWGPGNVQNNDFADINITITGGTFSSNPKVSEEEGDYDMAAYGHWVVENEQLTWNVDIIAPVIPDGYEVKEITTTQGDQTTTLYRVRKTITTVSHDINDNVEGAGKGLNENTDFIINADNTVTEEEVVANYVEVNNNAALNVPAGKTLEVTNGLDVEAGAQVVVEAGATLVAGEGGVITADEEGIVLESTEEQPSSFIMDPKVIVNTTPVLTVKMVANVGMDEFGDNYWHRFALPVQHIDSWTHVKAGDVNVVTYVNGWDYSADDWKSLSAVSEMVPFKGYTLTYDENYDWENGEGTPVTYTFQGQLMGNLDRPLNFQAKGYNFFGNSYTGYIDAKTLLQQIMGDDSHIDGTIYIWDVENQMYKGVSMRKLNDGTAQYTEVAPMQTFILQLRGAHSANSAISYGTAIWGNPRYGKVAAAPARVENNDNMSARLVFTANGKSDEIELVENAEFTDGYDRGADVSKFMNAKRMNVYATVGGENLSTVATDNIEGKTISLETAGATEYTLSFEAVNGEEYAVKDMLTGVVTNIEEGAAYTFAAQANAVNEARFMIISRAKAPTAMEEVEATAVRNAGIYTLTGMYIGATDMYNTLPAGVYVVDGVKVVK